jgi:hypothetical protein
LTRLFSFIRTLAGFRSPVEDARVVRRRKARAEAAADLCRLVRTNPADPSKPRRQIFAADRRCADRFRAAA